MRGDEARDDGGALPPRLTEGAGPAGDLLRRFARQTGAVPAEAHAWNGVLARLAITPRARLGLWLGMIGLAVGVAGAAALLVRGDGTPTGSVGATIARETGDAIAGRPRALGSGPPHVAPAASAAAAAMVDAAATRTAAAVVNDAATRTAAARQPGVASPPVDRRSLAARRSRQLALGAAPQRVPTGRSELIGEAHVALSPAGHAQAFVDGAGPALELVSGRVDLHVEKQTGGRHFRVFVPPYTFTVLGTTFAIERRTNGAVTLAVTEGRVAVSAHGHALAEITGGRGWSGLPDVGARPTETREPVGAAPTEITTTEGSPTTSTPVETNAARAAAEPTGIAPSEASSPHASRDREFTPAPVAPPVHASEPIACAAHEHDDPARALACYRVQAAGSGLPAEVALYQSARLKMDALSDPRGALDTLFELRRRFPRGALRVDAALSLAELLPRVGRFEEALATSAAFLHDQPGNERAAELHLLRGNIYREALHDCAAAEREYALLDGPGHTADQASFWRAICLETLGPRERARAAYRAYLARPAPEHAADAERRLRALE